MFFLAGCAEDNSISGSRLEPDEPLPYPEGGRGVSSDAGPGFDAGTVSSQPDAGADICIPDPCEGVVDPRIPREAYGEEALCFSFARVQNQVGLTGSGQYWRLRVVDFDLDSRPDIHLLRHVGGDQLFHNTPSGFMNVAAVRGLVLPGHNRDAVWKDADGDGDSDVFVAAEEGSRLYVQDAAGNFDPSESLSNPEFATTAAWLGDSVLLGTENGLRFLRFGRDNAFPASRDAAWNAGFIDPGEASALAVADYDGDGYEDVYVANNPGQDRLYRSLGDGTYESVEASLGLAARGNSIDAKWVRFQGERLPSLYVSSWDGSNFQYINNQDGTFREASGEHGLRDPGRTTVSTWGDFTQDIRVAAAHALRPAGYLGRDGQQNLLYIPVVGEDRTTVLHYMETAFPLEMGIDETTMGAEWFDDNGDGLLDLIVATYEGGLYLFKNRSHLVTTCPVEAIP